MSDKIVRTRESFGYLWRQVDLKAPVREVHFEEMQEVIQRPIVRGKIGIDAGSGCGRDTYTMALKNPGTKIVSLDISDGIYKTRELTRSLDNVFPVRSSVLDMPLKDKTLDFAYSFGVLHHTPDPERGLAEISRILKGGAYVHLYLYEDHSDNLFKYIGVKFTAVLRWITTRLPHKLLYTLCFIFSPVVSVIFTYPSRVLKRFKATKPIGDNMPFNFGTGPFSLTGDLYDRFSAPIEYRYNRQQMFDMLKRNKFTDIKVERMKTKAGWVAWGRKADA